MPHLGWAGLGQLGLWSVPDQSRAILRNVVMVISEVWPNRLKCGMMMMTLRLPPEWILNPFQTSFALGRPATCPVSPSVKFGLRSGTSYSFQVLADKSL